MIKFMRSLFATLDCWKFAAMHSKRFDDCYFGLRESFVDVLFTTNPRWFRIELYFDICPEIMHCIPDEILDDYQKTRENEFKKKNPFVLDCDIPDFTQFIWS